MRQGLNIVLYVNSFLPLIGGRELVVHYLATALSELGHNVRVIGAAGWWHYQKLDLGYPVYRYPALRGLFPHQIRYLQLLTDISLRGCDVIHAHATYPAGYIAARLKKVRNIPLVITPHGMDIHTVEELGHGLRLDPVKEPKIRYAIEHAELLTAISSSIKYSILDAGAPREKIRDVPNGVDVKRFEQVVVEDVYHWLKLPPDAKLIVTVGRYHVRKGQDVLIRAMPHILGKEPRARLVIIGAKTEALKPLIQDLGLDDKIVLTGAISPPALMTQGDCSGMSQQEPDWLAAIYRSSEVYVSAGINEGSEGLSLAVLEAMAAGLPIVATNISGNRDIVHDNENGFLVPPANHDHLADRILRILTVNELQSAMGIKAKEVASRYQWKEIARQYLAVYEEALDRRK